MTNKRKPLISGDLADAAAALLLCQHASPLVGKTHPSNPAEDVSYYGEGYLMDARAAASRYLVAAFDYAATAFEADEDEPE